MFQLYGGKDGTSLRTFNLLRSGPHGILWKLATGKFQIGQIEFNIQLAAALDQLDINPKLPFLSRICLGLDLTKPYKS